MRIENRPEADPYKAEAPTKKHKPITAVPPYPESGWPGPKTAAVLALVTAGFAWMYVSNENERQRRYEEPIRISAHAIDAGRYTEDGQDIQKILLPEEHLKELADIECGETRDKRVEANGQFFSVTCEGIIPNAANVVRTDN